jgi:hypothetical protein
MFTWFAYDSISGRMIGKPWRFVAAGGLLAILGAITVGAIDVGANLIYPYLAGIAKIAEDMIAGVVYSFAGALFGAAVVVKADALRKKDLKSFLDRKAWISEIDGRIKESEGDQKMKLLDAFIRERHEMLEIARCEGFDIDSHE